MQLSIRKYIERSRDVEILEENIHNCYILTNDLLQSGGCLSQYPGWTHFSWICPASLYPLLHRNMAVESIESNPPGSMFDMDTSPFSGCCKGLQAPPVENRTGFYRENFINIISGI